MRILLKPIAILTVFSAVAAMNVKAMSSDFSESIQRFEGKTLSFRSYENGHLKDSGHCSIVDNKKKGFIEIEGVNLATPSSWFFYSQASLQERTEETATYTSNQIVELGHYCLPSGIPPQVSSKISIEPQGINVEVNIYCRYERTSFNFQTDCMY